MNKVYICKATSSGYRWSKKYQVLEYQPLVDNNQPLEDWATVDEDIVGSETVEITLSELYRLVENKLGVKKG